jgi:Asp-tRNA(Asn)/Glu-tRNA(Gln) amidotransferase A subunit family amidase
MTPNNSVRDTVGPMTRTVADLAVLLDVMAGPYPGDVASQSSAGHIPKTYTEFLKKDGLKGARIGVLRQVFAKGADPRVIANFERTLAELTRAGAQIVDPFAVPELDALPRAPQTPARFKADIEAFLAARPSMPYPSLKAIVDSGLLHPLHQELFATSLASRAPEQDPATIEGLKIEQRYREIFTRAMDDHRLDAIIFPTSTRLPVINGDRNTQAVAVPTPRGDTGGAGSAASGGLTFVASSLQWPAISVPNGYVDGLPTGLQILGRRWQEAKLIQYAFAYEQATMYRRPPPTVPPLTASSGGH